MKTLAFAACALALPASLAAQEEESKAGKVTPLFSEDSILNVTIKGPINDIARKAERSTEPQAGTLEVNGEVLPVQISARGISRRRKDVCKFPPMRLTLGEEKPEGSLFRKQDKLKLVTHCNDTSESEQIMLREYTTYRLHNLITPISHKVRLLRVSYVDNGKEIANEFGFFIEDPGDVARRLGLHEMKIGKISSRALNPDTAGLYAMFQYMIGNTDWAMITGPDPTDCCHNTKLLGAEKESTTNFTPLPYDFDSTGLVNPPYAAPALALRLRNVQQRIYRGFCFSNSYASAQAARFRQLRPALEAEIGATPSLDAKSQAQMLKYLASFYADISDDEAMTKNLLKDCR